MTPQASTAHADRPLYYVLSAGRTGTVFLENLVKTHCPGVRIEHEPSPTRYLMMLGNLRNDFGLLGGAARAMARDIRPVPTEVQINTLR